MPTITANPAAQAQAATHRTDLLLARCRHHDSPALTPASTQQRWHSEQQRHFLAWLEDGGFAQSEGAIENSGIAPLFSAP